MISVLNLPEIETKIDRETRLTKKVFYDNFHLPISLWRKLIENKAKKVKRIPSFISQDEEMYRNESKKCIRGLY